MGQTPALIRAMSGENSRSVSLFSPPTYTVFNVDGAIAGNCLGVFVMWNNSNSPTLALTEDQGDTLTHIRTVTGSTFSAGLWMTSSATAGAHKIGIAFSTETGYITPIVFEVANCGGVDVSSGQESSGTTITPGSLAVGQSGDMLLHFAVLENSNVPATSSFTPGSQSNISWALKIAECLDGTALQYGVYSSASSINPSMTTGISNTWISMGLALKAASAGGVPTGMYVTGIEHVSLFSTADGGPGYSDPSVTQFPCSGSLLVAMGNGGSPITSISENGTNMGYVSFPGASGTYPPSYIGVSESETEQAFYSAAHTCNNSHTFSITPNLVYTGPGYDYDFTVVFYDIVNGGVLDTSASSSGENTSCSGTCTQAGPALTPGASGEMILNMSSQWYNQVNGISNASGFADNLFVVDAAGATESPSVDQDNGWTHYLSPNTNSYTVTYTYTQPSTIIAYWAAVAVAFKAAVINSSPVAPAGQFFASKR